MNYKKFLLLPFSFLYGCVVYFRNILYDTDVLFHTTEFDIPIISVGNITAGGTGKTPHVEYLVKLLKDEFKVATLSRGYGRNTKGYVLAHAGSSSNEIGDEPKQYKQKFPDITVAVCEKRVVGVRTILLDHRSVNTILLDDAFQHRAIKPGLSILLVEYSHLFQPNYLLPAGTLREWTYGSERADIIVVTKTPKIFSAMERRRAKELYQLQPYQTIYFSYIKYEEPLPIWDSTPISHTMKYYFEKGYHIIALTGIANPEPMLEYLKTHSKNVISAAFPDHHYFTQKDILYVKGLYDEIKESNKIILTTEKDSMRLIKSGFPLLQNLPVFYIPIEIAFHNNDNVEFDKQVIKYVKAGANKNQINPAEEEPWTPEIKD